MQSLSSFRMQDLTSSFLFHLFTIKFLFLLAAQKWLCHFPILIARGGINHIFALWRLSFSIFAVRKCNCSFSIQLHRARVNIFVSPSHCNRHFRPLGLLGVCLSNFLVQELTVNFLFLLQLNSYPWLPKSSCFTFLSSFIMKEFTIYFLFHNFLVKSISLIYCLWVPVSFHIQLSNARVNHILALSCLSI